MIPISEIALPDTGNAPREDVVENGLAIPDYLERTYWWAYVRPWAVRIFDRSWLIDLILYGNYIRLRDAALSELEDDLKGRTLQISCCYGSLVPELAKHAMQAQGRLDVVDILPVQIENARRKTEGNSAIHLERMNAAALAFPSSLFDNVLLYFLLHEMPQAWRERAVDEALRVLKPGGKIVIVDFGSPKRWNPFRYLWLPFLGILEPFAIPLWRHELKDILPAQMGPYAWKKESYFGGLFQRLVGRKPSTPSTGG